MGIFNIFNKKKQKSTDPRYNELIFGRFGVSPFIKQEPTKRNLHKGRISKECNCLFYC